MFALSFYSLIYLLMNTLKPLSSWRFKNNNYYLHFLCLILITQIRVKILIKTAGLNKPLNIVYFMQQKATFKEWTAWIILMNAHLCRTELISLSLWNIILTALCFVLLRFYVSL